MTTKAQEDYIDKFLDEYKKLCLKYNLQIDSCTCCDGPFISVVDENEIERCIKYIRKGESWRDCRCNEEGAMHRTICELVK